MQNCECCLYSSNHPLGLEFVSGVCTGCFTFEEKNTIDWSEREANLNDIVKVYKKSSRGYDCVIPVVGDAEDYYVTSKVLSLGLRPLIVAVNDYYKNDIGWHNLHNLITYFDVDSIVYNPDLSTYKELVRTSLRKYNHVLLPFLQLHTSFPVHIAVQRRIPLIIWGQNQSLEQVGKFSHYDFVEMTNWSREENDLFNVNIDTLISNGAQVNERYLNYYQYPKAKSINQRGVRGIYLSNYFRWDPIKQNSEAINYNYKPEKTLMTFDFFERAGSSVYYGIHDLLKFKRVGYRKVIDQLSREIRHSRIARSQASIAYNIYANYSPSIELFFDWLDVSQSGKKWFIDKHLQKEVDALLSNENFTFPVGNQLEKFKEVANEPSEHFIAFGKGI